MIRDQGENGEDELGKFVPITHQLFIRNVSQKRMKTNDLVRLIESPLTKAERIFDLSLVVRFSVGIVVKKKSSLCKPIVPRASEVNINVGRLHRFSHP